jgi:hypothetical protein
MLRSYNALPILHFQFNLLHAIYIYIYIYIVTCYATEDTHFELLLLLFTNWTLQSVIPLYYIYTAHNLTHQYSTEQYNFPLRRLADNSLYNPITNWLRRRFRSDYKPARRISEQRSLLCCVIVALAENISRDIPLLLLRVTSPLPSA